MYGWDHAIGFYVEIRTGRRVVATYDAVTPGYDVARPLAGALGFLVHSGFFSPDDIGEALVSGEEDLIEGMPARIRRVAEVVENFRAAAD